MVGKTLGHYVLLNKIGSGAMGVVYRARDQRLERDVAIKVLPETLLGDERSQQRLRKEALALSRLNHPNIAHVYDFNVDNGIAFLVMEYVQGSDLATTIAGSALPQESVVRIGIQVASALDEASKVGVVHRDIKPSNVMLTRTGDAKVLDFGLAIFCRSSEKDHTQSSQNAPDGAGTLPYMAPEQLKGESSDFRSDIYSLGAVLYEAGTGRRPFRAMNAVTLIAEIINKTPERPSTVNSHLSTGFDTVVMRCLAKEPVKRFERAADVRNALETISDAVNGARLAQPSLAAGRYLKIVAGAILVAALMVGGWAVRHLFKKSVVVKADEPNELAVLPLNSANDVGPNEAFDNGLVETLTNRLTQMTQSHPIQVVPASEIRAKGVTNLQEARQQFGATLGLEIAVERSGGNVRVNYALVDARNHQQISGDTITAPASDTFALEDRVADSLAKALELQLHPDQRLLNADRGTVQPAAYEYYLQGRGYLQEFQKKENLDSAVTEFTNALHADPNFALAYAGLGEAYWHRYELDKKKSWVPEAESACRQAVQMDSARAESHLCLGMIFDGTGKSTDAVTEYTKAIELEPTNDDAIRGLATTYANLGKNDDAETTYRAAIAARPQYWRNYNALGSLYFNQGKYTEAAKLFSQVVALAPDSFRGYSNLGGTYVQLGRYPEAQTNLEHSIAIRPTDDAYSNLGTALYNQDQFDAAAINYNASLKLNDQDYVTWGNLADAYYYSNSNRSQAAEAYTKAISLAKIRLEIDPNDAAALADVSTYYAALNNRDEAFHYLNRAFKASPPNNPDLLFAAAMVHEQFGETDASLAFLGKSLIAGYSPSIIASTPSLRNLHSNPTFRAMIAERTNNQ
jgi:serine/threonine protein kinase/tetratricopeptide (TPR) repeat protein